MIGLVLVTHGRLAEEFISATEHVVGPQTAVKAICIGPDDDMERRREDILQAVDEVDAGRGVILLTDMFGGTPSNLAMTFLEKDRLEVITGVNLPILIKLASPQGARDLLAVARDMREHGRNAIWVASDFLRGEKDQEAAR
jgi:PTS system mannose-specific IIA component